MYMYTYAGPLGGEPAQIDGFKVTKPRTGLMARAGRIQERLGIKALGTGTLFAFDQASFFGEHVWIHFPALLEKCLILRNVRNVVCSYCLKNMFSGPHFIQTFEAK